MEENTPTPHTRQTRHYNLLERFSYDLEMKMRKQNINNKQTEIERFDCFIEQIHVKSSRLQVKIVAYLVSIGWLLCLVFLYGWHFLPKLSLD